MRTTLLNRFFIFSLIVAVLLPFLASRHHFFEPEWGSGPLVERPEDLPESILVPAGIYTLGNELPSPHDDAPIHQVTLNAYRIDTCTITNEQFEAFVNATSYTTTAELQGGGWVYRYGAQDWKWTSGANWRHPYGPASSIKQAVDHPVVLVSWVDAQAYAMWAKKRLPTESEWEVAARSGQFPYPLGNPARDGSANVWQGYWPAQNLLTDGYFYTAPVYAFTPNPWGIYNALGNIWEWTENTYHPDPNDHSPSALFVARGGSWFCSLNYCAAYKPGFRGKSPPLHAFNNVGFRCASDY